MKNYIAWSDVCIVWCNMLIYYKKHNLTGGYLTAANAVNLFSMGYILMCLLRVFWIEKPDRDNNNP